MLQIHKELTQSSKEIHKKESTWADTFQKKDRQGAGEMAQWLRLVAEDPGSVPSASMMVHNCL